MQKKKCVSNLSISINFYDRNKDHMIIRIFDLKERERDEISWCDGGNWFFCSVCVHACVRPRPRQRPSFYASLHNAHLYFYEQNNAVLYIFLFSFSYFVSIKCMILCCCCQFISLWSNIIAFDERCFALRRKRGSPICV